MKYEKNINNLSLLNLEDEKPNLNLVVIGHVDSGKSTLMGHLLYLMGEVDEKTITKYKKQSKQDGKSTFHFAWALDEDSEERKRGVTVDIAYKHFQTKNKNITVMDAPGHQDFIPNMITGTSAADCGLLIVDSGKNSFDAGFFSGGQTKEHAILARSLGVKKLIICVNKLEIWDWSKERFDYIKNLLNDYLLSLDFKNEDLYFLPISGLQGVNLIKKPDDLTKLLWYEGNTLIELIDSLESPSRDYESPLRFSINDVGTTKVESLQGFGIFGKVESGVVEVDHEYLITPLNIKVKIRAIGCDLGKVNLLKAGTTGELLLLNDKSLPFDDIRYLYFIILFNYLII
jgi:elongation factor 1 alpha-like protein